MSAKVRTKHLYHAALLYALGKRPTDIERVYNTFWFVFEDEECEQILSNILSPGVQVDAQSLFDAIQTLKSHIFAEKQR